jgi:hypothetical protein
MEPFGNQLCIVVHSASLLLFPFSSNVVCGMHMSIPHQWTIFCSRFCFYSQRTSLLILSDFVLRLTNVFHFST